MGKGSPSNLFDRSLAGEVSLSIKPRRRRRVPPTRRNAVGLLSCAEHISGAMLTCSRVRTALHVDRTVAMMEEAFTVGEAVGKPAGCHDGACYRRVKTG